MLTASASRGISRIRPEIFPTVIIHAVNVVARFLGVCVMCGKTAIEDIACVGLSLSSWRLAFDDQLIRW